MPDLPLWKRCGHPRTPKNTAIHRDAQKPNGMKRRCRICFNAGIREKRKQPPGMATQRLHTQRLHERDRADETRTATIREDNKHASRRYYARRNSARTLTGHPIRARRVVVLSDIQLPFEDHQALDLALQFIQDYQPDTIVLNGDITDCYAMCLEGSVRVLTNDLRWVPCKDIKQGDQLWGFDENAGRGRLRGKARHYTRATVTQANSTTLPSWRLTFASGETIICSSNHRWLGWKSKKNRAVLEWIDTDEIGKRIKSGRPVLLNRPVTPWSKLEPTYMQGHLCAAFEGEGHITWPRHSTYSTAVAFSQLPGAFLDSVEKELGSLGFVSHRTIPRPETGVIRLDVRGGMWEHARFLGQIRPTRLLEKWSHAAPLEQWSLYGAKREAVIGAEFLGNWSLIALATTSKTFLAEGFASHNSQFDKNPLNIETTDQELDKAKTLMGLLSSIPQKIWLGGNHEDRWRKILWREGGAKDGISPIVTVLMHGLGIDRFDVDESWRRCFEVSKYGFTYWPYRHYLELAEGNLLITHGFLVSMHSGYSAKRHYERLGKSVIIGHTHRMGTYLISQLWEPKGAWENGCLCRLDPEYVQFPNWQQGFSAVTIQGNTFHVQQIPILPGYRIQYQERMFAANPPKLWTG